MYNFSTIINDNRFHRVNPRQNETASLHPIDRNFRVRKASELHDCVTKYIHVKPEKEGELLRQIESAVDILQKNDPEAFKELSRVGFSFLADIIHLPFLIYRDKDEARRKMLPLFDYFTKKVASPELIYFFLMQRSYGNHNLLHSVISTQDTDTLKRFMDYLNWAKAKAYISTNDVLTLLKDKDISGNNALHHVAMKDNLAYLMFFMQELQLLLGTGETYVISVQYLLDDKNDACYEPSSRIKDVQDYIDHLHHLVGSTKALRSNTEKSELEKAREELYFFKRQLDEKMEELFMRQTDIEELNRRYESSSDANAFFITELQQQISELQTQINQLSRQLLQATLDIQMLNSRLDDSQNLETALGLEVDALYEENLKLRAENDALRAKLDRYKHKSSDHSKRKSDKHEERRDLSPLKYHEHSHDIDYHKERESHGLWKKAKTKTEVIIRKEQVYSHKKSHSHHK